MAIVKISKNINTGEGVEAREPFYTVDGHLRCFHVLAIVNSAAMNIGVHVSFSILVSSGYMSRMGLLGHMVVLFLVF